MGAGRFSPAVDGALTRVYVPDRLSGDVTVIDPVKMKVVGRFKDGRQSAACRAVLGPEDAVGREQCREPDERQRDADQSEDRQAGPAASRSTIPTTCISRPTASSAIVVAEESKRLDFRDPHTMALQWSLPTPGCGGINHADFSIDGRYALFTCEYRRRHRQDRPGRSARWSAIVLSLSTTGPTWRAQALSRPSRKPASWREAPELGVPICAPARHAAGHPHLAGRPDRSMSPTCWPTASIWSMATSFPQVGFIPTGHGAHGLYPSRDGTSPSMSPTAARTRVEGRKHGARQRLGDRLRHPPGGRRPGGFPAAAARTWAMSSADGRYLWLSGRFDNVVYRFDTTSGAVAEVAVGREPHGLAVWPQPGRYSLGHTGNLR